jgi:hypothetical protein
MIEKEPVFCILKEQLARLHASLHIACQQRGVKSLAVAVQPT